MPKGIYKRTKKHREILKKGQIQSYKNGRLPSYGFKGHKHTDNAKKKNSEKHKNIKRTEETKQKIREYRLGQKQTEETKRKLRGENNKTWKGGQTMSKIRGKQKWLNDQEKRAGVPKLSLCQICGSSEKICFDHDHETGEFRGWICARCNLVLGHVKDNADLLESLAKYIKKMRNKGLETCS